MHIVVFGSGGVGGYFGGRLALAGEPVTFIARGEHLQAMLNHGLKVDSVKGDFVVQPVSATDDPSKVENVDAVLLCVKTWQVPSAAKAILPMLGMDTCVVPLENGVEAPSQLSEILGREHVLGGLCHIASHKAGPGYIKHMGIEPDIMFGELDNRSSVRSLELLHIFERAGVMARIPPDINVAIWEKFLFISAVSGLGAVTRVPFGSFRSLDATRRMLTDALNECFTVATAQGIKLPEDSVSKTLAFIDKLPPGTIASMQRDIMDGRPSELEAQNGAIVRMGIQFNVPTPVHSFMYTCLLPQENIARGQKE